MSDEAREPDGHGGRRDDAGEAVWPGRPGPEDESVPPTQPVPSGRGGPQRIPRPYNARPGGRPVWADVSEEKRRPSVDDLRSVFETLGPAHPAARAGDGTSFRPSAVLAPVYDESGLAHVVLTRRTMQLRVHAGEVSFPGGRVEAGESAIDGACREAKEEIHLDPSTVEVIGELDHLSMGVTGSLIVPYVGALPGRPDTYPNPDEVDAVLHVSLAELMDPAIYREEVWTFPDGTDRSIHFFELIGDTVWGATAAMLRQLLGIVTGTLGRGDLGHP